MTNQYEDLGAWRNRRFQIYEQIAEHDTINRKLLFLIEKYGSAFDDKWQYDEVGKSQKFICRRPLWQTKHLGGETIEKANFKLQMNHELETFIK